MKNYENYDPLFPDQPVVDLYLPIWSNLPAFKSKPAFTWVENDTSNLSFLSYSQLNSSASSISSRLPLQRGETVVILCSPGLDLVKLIFACQRAGLVIVPIYPSLPTNKENYLDLARVLSETTPKAAIANRSYIVKVHEHISTLRNDNKLSPMLKSLAWIAAEDLIISNNPAGEKVNSSKFDFSSYNGRKPDETYLIQYTSGATGPPKPVVITAGSAAHNARAARKAYDLGPNSVIASWLPQYHDCGLMFLLLTVVSGSTCVLTSPTSFLSRPRVWLEMMSDFQATCTPVPSFSLSLVLKRGGVAGGEINRVSSSSIRLCSLRNLILINEPIYRSVVEEFVNVFRPFGLNPRSVSPSYGLAENCTFVSTSWRPCSSSVERLPCHNKLLPIARLGDDDVDIAVVNEETLEAVGDGVEGEIAVWSPSNASGYLGRPILTHEVFRGRLSGRCFVRTGDRGVVLAKGNERFLYVTGRCFDVIKLSKYGQEIHAHYVESSAYHACRRFLRGGCLAAFEVAHSIVVVVAEISSDGNNIDGRLTREICEGIRRGVFKDEGIDVGLVVLVTSGCVPKTTSGKVKRWEAKERLLGGKMRVVEVMPFGDLAFRFESKEMGVVYGIRGSQVSNSSNHHLSLLSLLDDTYVRTYGLDTYYLVVSISYV